ncbi:MAG: hypothetical protein RL215_2737 [Planctomycetota bacterium]
MWFGDAVEDLTSVAVAVEESAALHQAKVFGSHGAWDSAGIGELSDGELSLEEHLDDAQAMGMSEDPQTFGGLFEGSEVCEAEVLGVGGGVHGVPFVSMHKYIGVSRYVNQLIRENFGGRHSLVAQDQNFFLRACPPSPGLVL